MANAGAIAALNNNAGKDSPRKRKRTVNIDDIRFSPAKKVRLVPGLKRRSIINQESSRSRRNSLSLPGDESNANKSEALQKRVRKLKARENGSNPSPLKSMGFSPQETAAPGRVNLNESPSKSLRNRNVIIPPPKDNVSLATSITTPVKRPTRLSVRRGEIEPPPETWDKDRDIASASKADHEDNALQEEGQQQKQRRSRGEDHTTDDDIDADGSESSQQRFQSPELSPDGHSKENKKKSQATEKVTSGKHSGHKKRRQETSTRPDFDSKAAADHYVNAEQPQDDEEEVHKNRELSKKMERNQTHQSKDNGDNEDEEDEERDANLAHGHKYILGIESVTSWHGCRDDWISVGGFARSAHAMSRGIQPQSEPAMMIRKLLKGLVAGYRSHEAGEINQATFQADVSRKIAELEDICGSLPDLDSRKERQKVVIDLYLHVISDTLLIVRRFMALMTTTEEPVLGWKYRHLYDLLALADRFSKQAVEWLPRPSMLDYGIMKNMRQTVRPRISRIYRKYQRSIGDMQRSAAMEKEMRELQAVQKLQLEAHARRREEIYDRIRTHAYHPQQDAQPQRDHVYDIDESEEEVPPTPPSVNGHLGDEETSTPTTSRPRLERQATEEIVPAPMDWTEDEKAALLNALELYHGEDRFWKILESCDELQTRSIDDLRTAALYFRDLVMSAPEFAGAVSTYSYLLCVE